MKSPTKSPKESNKVNELLNDIYNIHKFRKGTVIMRYIIGKYSKFSHAERDKLTDFIVLNLIKLDFFINLLNGYTKCDLYNDLLKKLEEIEQGNC